MPPGIARVAVENFLSPLSAVSTTLSALTMMTWSPVSMWGVKVGLCLPRRMPGHLGGDAAEDEPVGIDTYQARWISLALGE